MGNETKTATRSPFSPERAKDKPPRPSFSTEWETDGFSLSLFLVEKEKNKLSRTPGSSKNNNINSTRIPELSKRK
jgi:hypothetical protein